MHKIIFTLNYFSTKAVEQDMLCDTGVDSTGVVESIRVSL